MIEKLAILGSSCIVIFLISIPVQLLWAELVRWMIKKGWLRYESTTKYEVKLVLNR